MAMNVFDWISYWLLVVSGLAWGVYGITAYFGEAPTLLVNLIVQKSWIANSVYVIIGAMSIYGIYVGIKLMLKN